MSYALNDRPGVSAATRRRVLRVAEECGWQPNVAARSLSGRRPQTAGLVYVRRATERSRHLPVTFLSALQDGLSPQGVAVLLQIAADHGAAARTYRQWWAEQRVEAVVVPEPCVADVRLQVLTTLAIPAVVLGASPGSGLPSVWRDEAAAFCAVAQHLMSIGHRHLAHVAGDPSVLLHAARSAGMRQAAANHGAAVATVVTDPTPTATAAVTRRLLEQPVPPTAIVYENDVAAIVGLDVARRLGFNVPWDVSIVAGEDSALCHVTVPAVTALTREDDALGDAAARSLLAVLDGDVVEDVEVRRAVLAVRGSTSPAAP